MALPAQGSPGAGSLRVRQGSRRERDAAELFWRSQAPSEQESIGSDAQRRVMMDLKDVLAQLPTQPNSRIDELLPHRWKTFGTDA